MKTSIAILSFATALLSATPAFASTVTTTADSGPGSLRDAIANAAPGETINFAVTGTITLTSGELVINKDLTIAGPGAANLTVQRSTAAGTPEFRVFNVNAGIITINGLGVRNGRAELGGGINNETTLTLYDCFIDGNAAFGRGGGVYNLSTMTLSNCVINGNSVRNDTNTAYGGGIYSEGTVTSSGCVVRSNSVTVEVGGDALGGGIVNYGTLALTNSYIIGNSVVGGVGLILPGQQNAGTGAGGGIYNQGTAIVDTSTVGSNLAAGRTLETVGNDLGQGGGVANILGTVILVRCALTGNLATGSGALGGAIQNNTGSLTVESSTISGNMAVVGTGAAQGGAICNRAGSTTLNHSTITSNSAVSGVVSLAEGSGLCTVGGFVEFKNTILAGNFVTNDLSNIGMLINGRPSFGVAQSGGFNLIGTTNGPITPGTNDQFNVTAAQLKLGPLQDNGGPTFTHALLCGSPAIDAGDNTDAPPTDQRGFSRIVNGIIDIGAFEYSNSPPAITCSGAITNCSPPGGLLATVSANVADADGDSLIVIWTVDGTPYQTNTVSASEPPTTARVDFTATFAIGSHDVTATVMDPSDCTATCSTTVTVLARGDLYPIALHKKNLAGVQVGAMLPDIYNGVQPGNFGWLTWAGSPDEPTLVASLTPPGNSSTYVNPYDRRDRVVSVGDWVRGKPGVTNSDKVRKALDTLKQIDIVVPVWDRAISKGNNSLYHVVGFARVRITSYALPKQNRISARFLGMADCD